MSEIEERIRGIVDRILQEDQPLPVPTRWVQVDYSSHSARWLCQVFVVGKWRSVARVVSRKQGARKLTASDKRTLRAGILEGSGLLGYYKDCEFLEPEEDRHEATT